MARKTIIFAASVWAFSLLAIEVGADSQVVDAAARQDVQAVRDLLSEGIDVNEPREDGTTALMWAAHWDDREMVELLLDAGANVNAANDHGGVPLMRACENASLAVVETLVAAGADVNATQTSSGWTSLMLAAKTGNVDVVRVLLAGGADVNAATTNGVAALMWAIAAPHPDVVHLLLESGADVRVSSEKGFTPLLFAARNGDIETATLLIAAGADVNEPGSDGTLPLLYSIIASQDAFALFLLEQGADPNNGSMNGVTALHAAAGNVSIWLTDWYRTHGRTAVDTGGRGVRGLNSERRLPLVRTLLAHGAEPNARITVSSVVVGYVATPRRGAFEQYSIGTGDVRGATPLWVAAFAANGGGLFGDNASYRFDSSPEIVRALLAAGADPNLTTDDGTTPLMAATGLGYRSAAPNLPRGPRSPSAEETVKALVEAGVDVRAVNEADFTALHGAAFRGLNEVAEYLVEQGADIDARDYRGRTPFRLAEGAKQGFAFQEFPETAELLQQLGANTRLGVPGTVQERADRDVVSTNQKVSQSR